MSSMIFHHRPIYDERVKISDWDSIQNTKPYDCPEYLATPTAAHYKTFGRIGKHYPLETTMKSSYKPNLVHQKPSTLGLKRSYVNFTSYPVTDTEQFYSRLSDSDIPKLSKFINLVDPYLSTYQHSYFNMNPKATLPLMMANSHPMLNRKKRHELIFDPIRITTKFYDDPCQSDAYKCTIHLKNSRKK